MFGKFTSKELVQSQPLIFGGDDELQRLAPQFIRHAVGNYPRGTKAGLLLRGLSGSGLSGLFVGWFFGRCIRSLFLGSLGGCIVGIVIN